MNDDQNKIIEEKFVATKIIYEKGQWVLYVEIGDSESSVKHRINAYFKKSLAEIAAKWIKRTAEKENVFSTEIK